MLAIYRELNKDQRDTTALKEHLEECSACRQIFAQYSLIGERIRSLPRIEPPPNAQTKLMQALAAEHARFIQRTPSATPTPTPAFLTPYLNELAQEARQTDSLAAFSTADTGPLPVIRPITKRRRTYHMSQLAILGMAATFLMVLMISGLTSLLLLANGAATTGTGNFAANIVRPAQVAAATYQTTAVYPHVASAVANRQHIYYTTYNDNVDSWMLEAFDNQSKISSPLLPTVSTSPLIVLDSSQDWLVWLQLDPSKSATGKRGLHETENNLARTWSLHALYLGGNATQDTTGTTTDTSIVLHQDTFNPGVTSAWVHTPIQGAWLTQDTLFVTMIDGKGISHLWSYQLDSSKAPVATEIATADSNHILTSPTATSDNKDIYWSEEWITDKNVLSSNIWTQQVIEAQPERTGRWAAHTVTEKYLFRSDGLSFRPQIVQNTLFYLKANGPATNDSIAATPGTTTTTTVKGQATATKATSATTTTMTVTTNAPAVNVSSTLSTTRVDPTIYTPALDESVQGTLLAFSANGTLPQNSPQEDDRGLVSAPQGGSRFLLWQDSTKTFGMYDAVANRSVNIGTTTVKGAAFVAVNGDTAVWVLAPDSTGLQAGSTSSTVTFGMFSWPPKVPANQ